MCSRDTARIQVGCDTVKFAWPLAHDALRAALRWSAANGTLPVGGDVASWPAVVNKPTGSLTVVPARMRGAGRLKDAVDGWVYSWSDAGETLFAEGRLDPGGLVPAADLTVGADRAVATFEQLFADGRGCIAGVSPGLQRLDLAADVRFADGHAGTALLEDLADVVTPYKTITWKRAGRLETVAFSRNGRFEKIVFRAYDSNALRGGPVGEVIRLERQHRWSGRDRPLIADLGESGALWRSGLDALAAPVPAALTAAEVRRAVGSLSAPTAGYAGRLDRILGSWVRWRLRGEAAFSPSMRRRRLLEAADVEQRLRDEAGDRIGVPDLFRLVGEQWDAGARHGPAIQHE